MKKVFLILVLSAVLLLSADTGVARAGIEPATPSATPTASLNYAAPTILPNSPFYFLKRWWENIQLTVASNPTDRVKLLINISKERLAEASALVEQGKSSEVQNVLYDYSAAKKDQIKTIDSEGSKVDPLVTSTALADNLEELPALAVLKDDSPFKIDESTVNDLEDTVEVSTEVAVNQVDHPAQGEVPAVGAMPMPMPMPEMAASPSASPTTTPGVSSNTVVPPQINSVPSISPGDLSQSNEASSSATPVPSSDESASSSAEPGTTDQATTSDQSLVASNQSAGPPEAGNNLYSATDSAQPTVQGASTSRTVSLWDHLVNFFTRLFK